ncbi:protein-ADP-ribose hydrolase [Intestinibacter bartlettii]|uniref:Protein-ADP-ribose hydrolase n=1 Tax=Intestinibacter bartlettii TaxID=261299 RepID=A0ABS6DUD1_9FIRM|nr:protein-ADP-ribose hydrolase [Intestinibacter bartlettii]MBU5335438.1 protein-ADP-ribose hydrolase [Intestinibacter bartlettii]
MNQNERRLFLIQELLKEDKRYEDIEIPQDFEEQRALLRALMNVRIAKNIDDKFIKVQDEYLQEETKRKGIVDIDDLKPIKDGIYLWQGDITTLRCDAIVNAANSGMTGCYVPNHRCIDNCIHSFAGIQLRLECDEIMTKQGYGEPTGQAKITKSYNLPCKYVIHTVGPIINGKLTSEDCDLLASCYKSCLELAAKNNLESIAFCCISTGEFHFPNDKAAQIAVKTVEEFMKKETSLKKVIFNVFKDMDKEIYRKLLK